MNVKFTKSGLFSLESPIHFISISFSFNPKPLRFVFLEYSYIQIIFNLTWILNYTE